MELEDVPVPPAKVLARYRVENGKVTIGLPDRAWPGCLAIWFMLAITLISLAAYVYVDSKGMWIMPLIMIVVGGGILAGFYGMAAPDRTTLEIEPGKLTCVTHGLVSAKRRELAAGEINGIVLHDETILVRSDKGKEIFAMAISPAERKWIHAVLCRVLNKAELIELSAPTPPGNAAGAGGGPK